MKRRTGPAMHTGRRGLLGLGLAVSAALAPPPAQARRVPLALVVAPDPALRLAQSPPELRMALPVFDRENAALIRTLVGSPAFQRALAGAAAAPPPRVETEVSANVTLLRQVRDSFFRLSDPTLTADERNTMLPEDELPQLFEDVTLSEGPPAVATRGRDVIDQLAYWLMVTFDHTRAQSPADLTAAEVFTPLREQVLRGYAGEPRLAGLSPASRHDLSAWACLNAVFVHLKSEFAIRAAGNGGSSAAEVAMRSDLQAALLGFGLDPAGFELGRQGLRRRA